MNFENIRSVIWDLDGTLLDSFGIFCEVLENILPEFNRPMPGIDVIARNYHGSLNDSIRNALGGGLDPAEETAIIGAFLDLQNTHYEVIEHHLYQDALGLAEKLGALNIDQIIVTNRENTNRLNASPNYIVQNSSLAPLISEIIAGDSNGHRKPRPEVIEHLLKSKTVVPESTIVIGDQIVDLEFANNLRANSILVIRDHSSHLEDQIPDKLKSHTLVADSLDKIIV